MSSQLEEEARLVSGQSEYVCQCFKVTESDLLRRAEQANSYDFDYLRGISKVGSRCTSCEVEIRDILHEAEHRRVEPLKQKKRSQLFTRLNAALRPLPRQVRYLARKTLRVARRYEIFVVKGENYESELAISNLRFPDDEENSNGQRVKLDVILRDAAGEVVAEQRGRALQSDGSLVLGLRDLYPQIGDTFVGTLAIHFFGLRETGSLRPYCRLRYKMKAATLLGSCHYHDQFTTRSHYQHVIVTHPVMENETCWVALSNPVARPYESMAHLQYGSERYSARVTIPSKGAIWRSVPEIFSLPVDAKFGNSNGLFWLESDAPLMAWFFWHDRRNDAWSVQHK